MKSLFIFQMLALALFTSFAIATVDDDESVISNAVVVMPPPPVKISVIKSPNLVMTELGDVAIAPLPTVHYDINFRIARGPIQHARIAGDKTVQKIKELEYNANQKKQVFSVVSLIKAAR